MPKEHFSLEKSTALSSLPPHGKIHVVGVCGVAMAQLSIALSDQGFSVSGSDKEFYEPMGGLLKRSKVVCHQGFDSSHIPADVKLVVIGNAVSYGNSEVLAVEERGLPYTLFPKLLYESIIKGKHSIVVTGTHGKSTTSAMLAVTLEKLGRKPSYFVGAVAHDLASSLHAGTGGECVVEGDEYDSSFFAKVPKFSFYQPDTAIVTSIEYDHADIYPNLEAITTQFSTMVLSRPNGSTVIAGIDFKNVADLVPDWRKKSAAKIVTYGETAKADYVLLSSREEGGVQSAKVKLPSGEVESLSIQLPGLYNLKNALAVLIACTGVGISWKDAAQALSQFKGVKRRQEVRSVGKGVTLIEDFAHHPTAVRETLAGIRTRFPKNKVYAVFEPRSNTSRRRVFQNDYVAAFSGADRVVLCEVAAKSIDKGEDLLSVLEMSEAISKSGIHSVAKPDAQSIFGHLKGEVTKGDVVVIMSNGSFGGLITLLKGWLEE